MYECSQCDYETTWKDTLTRYIKSTQYGVECGSNYFDFRPLEKLTKMNSKYPRLFVKFVLKGKDLYNQYIEKLFSDKLIFLYTFYIYFCVLHTSICICIFIYSICQRS